MKRAAGAAARQPPTARALPSWAVVCFLCSGAAGLLYEVVWSKQLAYLLGSSIYSVATVVAAFLGGLALGARLLGSHLARRARLARSYAGLELAVAGLGLVLLPILRSLDGPVGQLYRAFGGESPAFAIARVVLLSLLLVPPAAMMGATLPVLVARCERGALGAGLAWLYAINTIGAVVGSVLGGFLLLPALGLTATTGVAAALNLVAAFVAWRSSGPEGDERRAATESAVAEPPLSPAPRTVFAGLFALSGFVALLLQLAWVRLFGLVFGSSVYSFSAVLGVYLMGIAIGSAAIARPLARGRAGPAWFAMLQLAIAFTAAAGMFAYRSLPRAVLELGERTGASWAGLLAGELALASVVILLPCLLMGAAFPVAARLLQDRASGETTGFAYAVNTVGTIAGSLATGFLLLPALGVQGVVWLGAGLATIAGLVSLALPGAPRPARGTLAAAALLLVATAAAGWGVPRWDPLLMSLGTFRPFSAMNLLQSFRATHGTGDPTRSLAASQHVLYYRDGINASVLVVTDRERKKTWMRVGGKVDAGTEDMLTQVLCGLIPAAMADSGARTLIVGHGSGVTAAAALAAGVGVTDIVELEPAVLAGSRFFHAPGEDPLDDPRVRVHVEDARTQLEHGEGLYDIVISEPSNPWLAGVNNLFTVDFYRRVRARLKPQGVFCQWLQLYELSPLTFQSLLASYLSVFPDAHLFCLWRNTDALLVAAPARRALALERLHSPALVRDLGRARLDAPEQIAAFYVASGAQLQQMAAGGTLNTDDRPFVEYRAPRDMIEVGRTYGSHHPGIIRQLTLPVEPPPGNPLSDWPHETVLAWRARQRLANADREEAGVVLAELRDAGFGALATRLASQGGASAGAAGDPLADARARLAAGDVAGASAAARSLLATARGPSRLEPLLLVGVAEFGVAHEAEALAAFAEAQSIAPRDPRAYAFEARVRLAGGDAAGARGALARGLARSPADSVLKRALHVLEGATAPRAPGGDSP
ncbi:MAG TPA: fused MFS/spermidine synthase [Methylomirabilota bacterium]|nr:fused MFS/spermidine synthase [Methylomirabilota bacterium]